LAAAAVIAAVLQQVLMASMRVLPPMKLRDRQHVWVWGKVPVRLGPQLSSAVMVVAKSWHCLMASSQLDLQRQVLA
jgi:hypothetical protein